VFTALVYPVNGSPSGAMWQIVAVSQAHGLIRRHRHQRAAVRRECNGVHRPCVLRHCRRASALRGRRLPTRGRSSRKAITPASAAGRSLSNPPSGGQGSHSGSRRPSPRTRGWDTGPAPIASGVSRPLGGCAGRGHARPGQWTWGWGSATS
jgi:hypothetical protein